MRSRCGARTGGGGGGGFLCLGAGGGGGATSRLGRGIPSQLMVGQRPPWGWGRGDLGWSRRGNLGGVRWGKLRPPRPPHVRCQGCTQNLEAFAFSSPGR